MPEIVPPQIRQNRRYLVNGDADVTVTIDQGDGVSESVCAELADISVGGAKFKTDTAFRIKKIVAVRIEASTPPYNVEVDGEVCWATPVSGDAWYVGCAFRPPLPAELLQEFAEAGVLERRHRRREIASLSATAKWELEAAATSVSILDYSPQGGFCLLAPSPGQPGGRVELLIEWDGQKTRVRGKIQWRCRTEEGYLVGCEFLSGRDSIHFAGCLGDEPSGVGAWKHRCGWLESLRKTRTFTSLAPLAQRKQVRRQLSSTAAIGVLTLLWSVALSNRIASPPTAAPRQTAVTATAGEEEPFNTAAPSATIDERLAIAEATGTSSNLFDSFFDETADARRGLIGAWGDESRSEPGAMNDLPNGLIAPVIGAARRSDTLAAPPPPVESDLLSAAIQRERLPLSPPKPAAPEQVFRDRHDDRRQSDVPRGPIFSSDQETSPVGIPLTTLPPYQFVDLVDWDAAFSPAPDPAPILLDAPSTTTERTSTTPETPAATLETSPDRLEPTPATTLAETPTTPAEPDPQQALIDFREGCAHYRQQQFEQAILSLQAAMQADPAEPVFVYVLAMAQFRLEQYGPAEQSVETAVTLEGSAPIRNWGQQMESFQGPPRGWLEKTRRQVRQQFDAAEL